MIEAFVGLLSLTVIVHFIEAVLPPQQLSAIGEYVFGLKKIQAGVFERTILGAVVALFSSDNRLSWWKILVFTCFYSSIFGAWGAVSSLFYDFFDVYWVVVTVGMAILIGYPTDVLTLVIAKVIWVRWDWLRWPWTAIGAIFLALPAIISMAAITVTLMIFATRIRYGLSAQIAQGAVLRVQLVIWLVPVLLTVAGGLIRIALQTTKVGHWLLERTNVHRHPLTYVWLFSCLVLSLPAMYLRQRFL